MTRVFLTLTFFCALYAAVAQADNYVVVTPNSPPAVEKSEKSQNDQTTITRKIHVIERPLYFFSDYGLSAGARQLSAKKYADAITSFENVLDRNPRNIDALAGLGASYLGLKETKQAGDYIRKALARDNKHIGANYLYGRYYLLTGEVSQAVDQMTLLDMLCGRKYNCPEAASLSAEINEYKKQ